jgi:hypothetical protein
MAKDIETVRDNERFKAIAGLCDTAGMGLLVACTKLVYDDLRTGHIEPVTALLTVVGALLGLALFWMAWHIRGQIQSED